MHSYYYRLPSWHYALQVVLVLLAAGAFHRIYVKWNGDGLNLALMALPIVAAMYQVWRELDPLGATLTVSQRGIEYIHPRRRSRNWMIPAAEIDYVAAHSQAFSKLALIARKNGTPRQIQLGYWQPKLEVTLRGEQHPMLRSLGAFFPLRELTREEAGMVMMKGMELGRVAGYHTYAMLGLLAIGFLLLFLFPMETLGEGIPNGAIAGVYVLAAAWSGYGVYRDPTAELRVPIVPLLFAGSAAFFFTMAAHKVVHYAGERAAMEFRFSEVVHGNQVWKADGEIQLLIDTRKARYTEPGTVVALEIRRGPFGIDSIHRESIMTLVRR